MLPSCLNTKPCAIPHIQWFICTALYKIFMQGIAHNRLTCFTSLQMMPFLQTARGLRKFIQTLCALLSVATVHINCTLPTITKLERNENKQFSSPVQWNVNQNVRAEFKIKI
uniref:Uncharacterized protein n=1 Tax=Rhipicephalus microplus TaxID=6941 RepID=A0A6G5AG28_RHIMP